MKKLLLILLCLPLLFTTCKKEESAIEPPPTIYNAWQLSMQSTSLAHGDLYTPGIFIDSSTGVTYSGQINSIGSVSIMVSNDTIFPGLSTSYSSRVWSINQNQIIIDAYYDGNGLLHNTLQHSFIKNSDTLVINFQSGEIKEFIINELTADYFHITSIPGAYIDPFSFQYPLFDENGVYQDTVLLNITSDKYFFNIMQ